jgi:Flp pilus assembly protein TadG
MRAIKALGPDCRGSSAVEFAILAPVFLLLLTGMSAYALYFGCVHSVQQLAADAARVSVAGLTLSERNSLVRDYLDQNAAGYMLIDRDRLEVLIGDKAGEGSQYQVTLAYDASALPIWNLYPPLPLPAQTITSSSTIRWGGV